MKYTLILREHGFHSNLLPVDALITHAILSHFLAPVSSIHLIALEDARGYLSRLSISLCSSSRRSKAKAIKE
jgi:hypothetical protein